MAFVNAETGEVNNSAYGLDIPEAKAGNPSILTSVYNLAWNAPVAVSTSILQSFANTAIDVGNWFKEEKSTRYKPEDWLGEDTMNFYTEHKQGVDAVGLIAGSFIPGTLAIKALKLAQAGRMTEGMQLATNFMAGPQKKIIDESLAIIKAGNAALFPSLRADKYKAIALGYGEQALQGLVYETATYATMKASPLLDQDGYKEVVENMFYGALLGGVIGGSIEGLLIANKFEKATKAADLATKQYEIAKYLNRGNYSQGDKVAELINSLDKIPAITEETSQLAKSKAAKTQDTAILNAKLMLGRDLAAEDKELASAVVDTLLYMTGKKIDPSGTVPAMKLTSEQLYESLARLAKISRIGTEPSIPTKDIFYINRYAGNKLKGENYAELIKTAHPKDGEAALSLAYRLRPFSEDISVAHFDDGFMWGNSKVPRYNKMEEAFDAGHDIFIDRYLRTYVNPKAPNMERIPRPGETRVLTVAEEKAYRATGELPSNSKPLFGAPLILNRLTGDITESAAAVVGDFGAIRAANNGLHYGDKFSIQSATSGFSKDLPTIDANARYVWFAENGVAKGSQIAADDIPALEELYRNVIKMKEGAGGVAVSPKAAGRELEYLMERDKISVAGVSFADENALLSHIREEKNTLIQKLLAEVEEKNLSSADIALRANVSEDYIANQFNAKSVADYMVDVNRHKQLQHVQLEYDVGRVFHDKDGMILRGMQDVQYRIDLNRDAANTALASHFGGDWEKFQIKRGSEEATVEGTGAKAFSSSNSAYASFGQKAERVGREVTAWSTKKLSAVADKLAPAFSAVRNDPAVFDNLRNFVLVRRSTGENYRFIPKEVLTPELKAKGFTEDTVVLTDAIKKDKFGRPVELDLDYLPEGFQPGDTATTTKGLRNYYHLGAKEAAFERMNQQVNDARIIAWNKSNAAVGDYKVRATGNLYTPPIDTTKYPFFVLVKKRPGYGMADDGVAIITAESEAQLKQKVASLNDTYSVYDKEMLKKHHEVMGDYEYDKNFANRGIQSDLMRKGVLNNVFPDGNVETLLDNYINWHSRQELRLTRDYVELGNSQLFAELKAMGSQYEGLATSQTGFTGKYFGKTAENPYDSFVKTALAISEKETYRLWADANDKAEAFFSTAFRVAKEGFLAARKDIISYEQATATSAKYGLGNPYEAATNALKTYQDTARHLPPARYLSQFTSTTNSILSATAVRLDQFQSLVNIISTPVLLLAEANSAKTTALKELITTELPDGSGKMIPATSKVLFNSIKNWFDKETREKYNALYKATGDVRDKSSEMFDTIEKLTLPYGSFSESKFLKTMKDATDKAAKLTGSEYAEELARFMAADSARQIFEAAGYVGRELSDNISTFVNRVHGNYVASQRPVAFQGPLGQAIGLFQTYQFNLMQQVFRYVAEGEAKTLAILAGMQSTLFGMQSLPGFQAINNHIVGNAAGNPEHKDAYSTVPAFMDRKLGNYLLYGVTSNWLDTGIYTRGDISPRQITVLPVNPLDYPAISGGIKFMSSILNTAEKIAAGGNTGASLLIGLEHNGLSRPLTGLSQLAQGFTTTSSGELVSKVRPEFGDANAGLSDYASIANMSRLLGARPLDEAITLDAMYRTTLYKAKNSTRIKDIGEAVRSTMYAGNTPSAEQIQDFMSRYAAAGGDVANFNRKLYEWSLSANASVANKVFEHLKNPLNQQMSIIMGGRPLPDYSMSYATPNKRGEEPTMPAIPNLKAASTAVSM